MEENRNAWSVKDDRCLRGVLTRRVMQEADMVGPRAWAFVVLLKQLLSPKTLRHHPFNYASSALWLLARLL